MAELHVQTDPVDPDYGVPERRREMCELSSCEIAKRLHCIALESYAAALRRKGYQIGSRSTTSQELSSLIREIERHRQGVINACGYDPGGVGGTAMVAKRVIMRDL
jgi:hypothetical protein